MKRWTVKKKVVIAVALLTLGCLVITVMGKPFLLRLVRHAIAEELRQAGLPRATFSHLTANTDGVQLERFSSDPGGSLTIDRLSVDLSVASLLAGRAENVTLTGLTLRLGLGSGQLDFGSLAPLLNGSGLNETGDEFPVNQLLLEDGAVIVHSAGTEDAVLFTGRVERRDEGVYTVFLKAGQGGGGLTLTGGCSSAPLEFDLTGEVETLSVPRFLACLTGAIPPHSLTSQFSVSGSRLDNGQWQGALLASKVQLDYGPYAQIASTLNVSGTLSLSPGDQGFFRGELELGGGRVTNQELGLTVLGITGKFPWGWDSQTRPGNFAVDKFIFQERQYPGVTGQAAIGNSAMSFTGEWPLIPGHPVCLNGEAGISSGSFEAGVRAVVPVFELGDDSLLPNLLGAGKAFKVGGRLGLNATIDYAKGKASEGAILTLEGLRLSSTTWDAALEGISGTVALSSLDPPMIAPWQTITFSKAKMGDIIFQEGAFSFALSDSDRIKVKTAKIGCIGGQLTAGDFSINLRNFSTTCDVALTGANLSEFLRTFSGEHVSGEGTLTGKLTVAIPAWPQLQLKEGGWIRSDAPGVLRFHDTAMMDRVLIANDPRFRDDPQMKITRERLTSALQDFAYEEFNINIIQGPRGRQARVHTWGQGRSGQYRQGVNLTVNLSDLDRQVERAIFGEGRVDAFYQFLQRKLQPNGSR